MVVWTDLHLQALRKFCGVFMNLFCARACVCSFVVCLIEKLILELILVMSDPLPPSRSFVRDRHGGFSGIDSLGLGQPSLPVRCRAFRLLQYFPPRGCSWTTQPVGDLPLGLLPSTLVPITGFSIVSVLVVLWPKYRRYMSGWCEVSRFVMMSYILHQNDVTWYSQGMFLVAFPFPFGP